VGTIQNSQLTAQVRAIASGAGRSGQVAETGVTHASGCLPLMGIWLGGRVQDQGDYFPDPLQGLPHNRC
jgi:hypothetical protein